MKLLPIVQGCSALIVYGTFSGNEVKVLSPLPLEFYGDVYPPGKVGSDKLWCIDMGPINLVWPELGRIGEHLKVVSYESWLMRLDGGFEEGDRRSAYLEISKEVATSVPRKKLKLKQVNLTKR